MDGIKEEKDRPPSTALSASSASAASTTAAPRLGSVRASSDFTLGGAERTRFAPTIPSQRRERKKSEPKPSVERKPTVPATRGGRGRGGRRSDISPGGPVRVAFSADGPVGWGGSSRYHLRPSGERGMASSSSPSPSSSSDVKANTYGKVAQTPKDEAFENEPDAPIILTSNNNNPPPPAVYGEQQMDQLRAAVPVEGELLFVQLPSSFPMSPTFHRATEEESAANALPSRLGGRAHLSIGPTTPLAQMGSGFLGKLRVRRSGKMEMQLQDVVFDVVPGMECAFRQDVMSLDPSSRSCFALGEITQRLTCMLNVEDLLETAEREAST